jgi:hypothetical protein
MKRILQIHNLVIILAINLVICSLEALSISHENRVSSEDIVQGFY